MPKMTIEVDACHGCYKKDGTLRQATESFTIGGLTWHLCEEHSAKLAEQFIGILGDPREDEE